MMKCYKYTGKGLAIGAVVVVLAKRKDQAGRLAKKWAAENGVDPYTLKLCDERTAEVPSIVYGWNGDY